MNDFMCYGDMVVWHASCLSLPVMKPPVPVRLHPRAAWFALASLFFAVTMARAAPEPAVTVTLPSSSRPFIAVAPATRRPDAVLLTAPARVVVPESARAAVGAPVAGRVRALHVSRDARVAPNAPLVTLLAADAASARAAVASAQAIVRAAEAEVARQKRMGDLGVATELQRVEAARQLAEARAELARSRAVADMLGPGDGGEVVVRAPVEGTVLDLAVTVGAAVTEGAPLLELGDASRALVVAEVFDRDLPRVVVGAEVEVSLAGLEGRLTGRVASTGAAVRAASRTVPVRVTLDAQPASEALREGLTGRVAIRGKVAAITVPTAAVLLRGAEPVVYVERGDATYERRAVRIGQPLGGQVVIHGGLVEGERVVVKGALLLDGAADQLL
jgi:cobalt-zinc-cadmium efflux system membrane fusion protein